MLHGTIRNDDFQRNTGFTCWNNVAPIRNNVTRGVASLYAHTPVRTAGIWKIYTFSFPENTFIIKSGGLINLLHYVGVFTHLAPVVQKLDSAIHRIKIYPVYNAIGFRNTYPLDSDLSGGQRYPTFGQPGPEGQISRPLLVTSLIASASHFYLFPVNITPYRLQHFPSYLFTENVLRKTQEMAFLSP